MSAPGAPWHDFAYAWIRAVPHVHLDTGATVGVVVHAPTAAYLGAHVIDDPAALRVLAPGIDQALLARALAMIDGIARGDAACGALAALPASERFHWLTAPRSAVVQPSAVHVGRTHDPAATLDRLFALCRAQGGLE